MMLGMDTKYFNITANDIKKTMQVFKKNKILNKVDFDIMKEAYSLINDCGEFKKLPNTKAQTGVFMYMMFRDTFIDTWHFIELAKELDKKSFDKTA